MFKRIALASFAVAVIALGAQAAEFKLKLGHGSAPDNPRNVVALEFAKAVEAKTNGRVTIEVFPSESLGSDRQMIESLIMGGLDLSINSQGPVAAYDEKLNVVGLPFLFSKTSQVYEVLDGPIGEELALPLEKKGIKILSFWDNGFRHITNNKRPINKPADLVGLKIRTPEDKLTIAIFKALGANPAPFAFGELYMALQQGQFDGQENPVTNIYYSKLYEVQKYLSLTNHKYEFCPLIISVRTWNKLPKDIQTTIKSLAVEYAGKHRELNNKTNADLAAKMSSLNVQVNQADVAALREACKSVYKQFEPNFGKELIEKVVAIASK